MQGFTFSGVHAASIGAANIGVFRVLDFEPQPIAIHKIAATMTAMEHRYQAYFCEENIWHLCQESRFADAKCDVVFICNAARSVAISHQKLGPRNGPIFWDYHVVLLVSNGENSEVWDFDSRLSFPVDAKTYFESCFPFLVDDLVPMFRVIERQDYLSTFKSDRSHMVGTGAEFPEWPKITESESNLEEFLSMKPGGVGQVMRLEEMLVQIS